MSLYPIIQIDPSIAVLDPNKIPSGTLIVIPIDMTTVNMTSLTISQVSNTQDFSLRAWVSIYRDGDALPSPALPQPSSGIYPVLRWVGLPLVLYLPGFTPPDDTVPIALPGPGLYYFNLLNLTNELNYFGFGKTDLV